MTILTLKNAKFFVLGFAALALMTGPVWAKGEAKKEETKKEAAAPVAKDPWQTRCDDMKDGEKVVGKYCEMVQQIFVAQKDADPSTAQRLIEVVIGYPPADKGKASAVIILPLGILLDEKNTVEVDGAKLFDFGIRYCDNGGCAAVFQISEKDMAKLGKGKEMLVKGKAANGQDLVIAMSLQGFDAVRQQILPAKETKK